jgi:Xaa-Pro aminopeptidase
MAARINSGPPAEIKERITRCRRQMKKVGAGAFLVSNPRDFFYLTGFSGDESAVMVTPRDVYMISDGRFEEQLKKEAGWAKTYMRRGMLNDEIAKACEDLKIKKLAVQSEALTLADHDEINRLTNGTRLVAAPTLMGGLRILKSPGEVRAMSKALRNAEEAFVAMRQTIKVGQTELEMAARLEYEMKARGATAPSFPTICAEGANAALPHASPGQRKVKRGSAILFDWGARVNGYCSDLTRMVFVGGVPRKIGEIYDVVLDAQLAAIDAIRPGRRMCDIDAVARKIVTDAGYGDQFNHGLGHGLGIDVHEAPSLSWRSTAKLEPGMLVTVEPGIYLPGVGGVRIEDDVLITTTGKRVLSTLSKRLQDAVIRR